MGAKDVKVFINGIECGAVEGEPLIDVARRNGIFIPTLCYEESLEAYGACRMCLVEIKNEGVKKKIATSCTLQAFDGLSVETDSEEVLRHRKLLLELYLAQAPNSSKLKELALRYGVSGTRFRQKMRESDPLNNSCVLCGLCVRVCNEVMGAGVINFIGRGEKTRVNTPYFEQSELCLGCRACAEVCPTGAIEFRDEGSIRIAASWSNTTVELKRCSVCGKYYAPLKLDKKIDTIYYYRDKDDKLRDMCPDCRKKAVAKKMTLIAENEVEKYAR